MDLDNDGTVTLQEMKKFMTEIGNNPLGEEEWLESANRARLKKHCPRLS